MKKCTILLTTLMLVSAVASVNCKIITKKITCKENDNACETKTAREVNATQIEEKVRETILERDPRAKSLEIKREGKYIGILVRNEDEVGYAILVYSLDTMKVVMHREFPADVKTFEIEEDAVILKYTGFWRSSDTLSLVGKCKKCGKNIGSKCKKCGKSLVGTIIKRRVINGWVPRPNL